MNVTRDYSTIHRGFVATARRHDLTPMDVRLLVALSERGGSTTSDHLQTDLHLGDAGSAVRRSLVSLRSRGLLCGGSVRGRRDPIEITTPGTAVVEFFNRRIRGGSDGAE